MGNGYLPAAPEKNPGPPARQSAVCEEDLIYISICSGGVIIKISAADRPTLFSDSSLSSAQSSL
jgi:hypothetical protein